MKIAVFYHCKICGWGIPDSDFAVRLVASQMDALNKSGLADAADEIHVGINGGTYPAATLRNLAPKKAFLHVHGDDATSEIPTLRVLQDEWLRGKQGWYVLYHHSKSVTHPNHALYENWKNRMQGVCVMRWRECVADLDAGYEAVGCHWLTGQQYPGVICIPFFGGTFWWATANYLMQLPTLPPATWGGRGEAECWIGRRRPYPKVKDYIPGWP